MYITIITQPSIEPVTLEEAKKFLRIDDNYEDDLIAFLIKSAREKAEGYTGRVFINQTVEVGIDSVPCGQKLYLPFLPVREIESVTVDGVLVQPDQYYLVGDYAFCAKADLRAQIKDGVVIHYVSGYGDTAEDVPADIREAILIWVANTYEQREEITIPPEVKLILWKYRGYLL